MRTGIQRAHKVRAALTVRETPAPVSLAPVPQKEEIEMILHWFGVVVKEKMWSVKTWTGSLQARRTSLRLRSPGAFKRARTST